MRCLLFLLRLNGIFSDDGEKSKRMDRTYEREGKPYTGVRAFEQMGVLPGPV
jgi:hypothetical protein